MFKQVIFSMLVASVVMTSIPSNSFARGDGGNGGNGGNGGGAGGGDIHDRGEHSHQNDRNDQRDQDKSQRSNPFPPLALDLCEFRIAGTSLELCLDSRL